ncbi:MAG: transposase [candidate division Zixibacteria bacterium]|nr:transposase [candidate division Zixibacteria bacterium]
MSKLIRHFLPGQSCFITSVTANREPLLVQHARLLARAVRRAGNKDDFKVVAWVVLPDHFHLILNAPNGDTSRIMQRMKLSFSGQYKSRTRIAGSVWQPQYWDHIIRSQEDMNRHIDYIHYNPVKHGLADSPKEYRLSSFKKYCREGKCDLNWREIGDSFGNHEYGK